MKKIPLHFYQRPDTELIARELLGKYLFTNWEGKLTGGRIVETEAYLGKEDKACHAFGGRRTGRTEIMYAAGGVAYVYLIYGMYHLFNVITHSAEYPEAVLIRGLEPVNGLETMLKRRNMERVERRLTAGPGTLTMALGIRREHTGTVLDGEEIWLEDRGELLRDDEILASARVGVDYAGEHAAWPLRFRIRDNRWTSPAK